MECIKETKSFGGMQRVFRHSSVSTSCDMEFAIYDPEPNKPGTKPVLFYLSGLTCTWANVAEKAGVQKFAADHGLLLVMPDTSPRGLGLTGEDDDYDFGSGAGFYINATQQPWSNHYLMFDYVTTELPEIVIAEFGGGPSRLGVTGHSMGGHGALLCALKRPDIFRSCSAFSPIGNPSKSPWGVKAFSSYLGVDRSSWALWDACHLAQKSNFNGTILIDQGDADPFLKTQLMPEALSSAFLDSDILLDLRFQAGYDHSYYFISSFIGDHVIHHANILSK